MQHSTVNGAGSLISHGGDGVQFLSVETLAVRAAGFPQHQQADDLLAYSQRRQAQAPDVIQEQNLALLIAQVRIIGMQHHGFRLGQGPLVERPGRLRVWSSHAEIVIQGAGGVRRLADEGRILFHGQQAAEGDVGGVHEVTHHSVEDGLQVVRGHQLAAQLVEVIQFAALVLLSSQQPAALQGQGQGAGDLLQQGQLSLVVATRLGPGEIQRPDGPPLHHQGQVDAGAVAGLVERLFRWPVRLGRQIRRQVGAAGQQVRRGSGIGQAPCVALAQLGAGLVQGEHSERLALFVGQGDADAVAAGDGLQAGDDGRESLRYMGAGIETLEDLAGGFDLLRMAARLLEQAGVLQRGGGLVGQGLEGVHQFGGEETRLVAVDVKGAEGAPAADEGEGGAGAETFRQGCFAPGGEVRVLSQVLGHNGEAAADGAAGGPLTLWRVVPTHGDLGRVGVIGGELGEERHAAVRLGAAQPGQAGAEDLHAGAAHLLGHRLQVQALGQLLGAGVQGSDGLQLPDDLLLGLLARGDVRHTSNCPDVVPLLVSNRPCPQGGIDSRAIFPQKLKIVLFFDSLLAALQGASGNLHTTLIHELRQMLPLHLIHGVSQHLCHARIDEGREGVFINDPNAFLQRFD